MNFMAPTSDVGFKKLFGNEHNINLTKVFLNSLLGRTKEDANLIETIKFIDTENKLRTDVSKQTYLDLHVTDERGQHFIIETQIAARLQDEMQNKQQKFYIERAQYYSSLIFSQELDPNLSFDRLVPVITISVLSERLFSQHDDVISYHTLMDVERNTITSNFQTFYFIELSKFNKKFSECDSRIDQWLFFIKNAHMYHDIPQEMKKSKDFVQAFESLEQSRWTRPEFVAYMRDRDNATREERIKLAYLDEGEKQGEFKAKQKTAINLLKMGVSVEIIVQATGLSMKEINAIVAKDSKK